MHQTQILIYRKLHLTLRQKAVVFARRGVICAAKYRDLGSEYGP
jgi:hypothetical protein